MSRSPFQISRRGPLPTLLAWPVPVFLVALWWIGSTRGWIPPQTLPAPGAVMDTLAAMARSGELLVDIEASLRRVVTGFLLGTGAGLVLGAVMGLSSTLRQYLYPSFRIVASVPELGWLPLLVLWLGIGESLKYVLIAKAALVPVTLNTCQGLRHVPASYRELAATYRLSRLQLLSRVLLPSAFPSIWNGVRYGLSSCWLILVLVELLASSEGLGYMMMYGQQLMQMDVLLGAVLIVGAIGYLLDRGLGLVERRLLRWRPAAFA